LPLAEIAEVTAVRVDHDSGTQAGAQPLELTLIQDEIVGVGLRVVIRIGLQRGADQVQAAAGIQSLARDAGATREVIRSEHLLEVVREILPEQLPKHRLGGITRLRRGAAGADAPRTGVAGSAV